MMRNSLRAAKKERRRARGEEVPDTSSEDEYEDAIRPTDDESSYCSSFTEEPCNGVATQNGIHDVNKLNDSCLTCTRGLTVKLWSLIKLKFRSMF